MTAPADPSAVLAELERRAREHDHQAQCCREAAAQIRAVFGLSPLADMAPAQPTIAPPAVVRRGGRRPKAVRPAPRATGARQRIDWAQLEVDTIAFLRRQKTPVAPKAIAEATGATALQARAVLQRLLKAKAIVKTGKTTQTRIALAGAAASARGDELREALARVLADGASHDAREIAAGLRASLPDIDLREVEPFLESLVADRRVERIPVAGGQTRYRRLAKAS